MTRFTKNALALLVLALLSYFLVSVSTPVLPSPLHHTLQAMSKSPSESKANSIRPCLLGITSTDSIAIGSPEGELILAKNLESSHIPASTLKVFTGLLAMRCLGPDYRFNTDFFMTSNGDIVVKGYGDPLLISEVIDDLAKDLSLKISKIKDVILDNSYFASPIIIPGAGRSTNPYDAPVGALCVNFNTFFISRDRHGNPVSAEPQTPLVPLAREKAIRLNLKKGRYTLTHEANESAIYAGQIIAHFLRKNGIIISGKIRIGTARKNDRLILSYVSPFSLGENLRRMLEFSNNFMANQILIAIGAQTLGPPGTLEKGLRAARDFAKNALGLHHTKIVEGSGISRANKTSASDMLVILREFKPFRNLLRHDKGIFYKTGTLSGIKTCVGYFEPSSSGIYPYAIFLDHNFYQMNSLLDCLYEKLKHR